MHQLAPCRKHCDVCGADLRATPLAGPEASYYCPACDAVR